MSDKQPSIPLYFAEPDMMDTGGIHDITCPLCAEWAETDIEDIPDYQFFSSIVGANWCMSDMHHFTSIIQIGPEYGL